jgi:hypothetical protein
MNPEGLAVGKHPWFIGFAELAKNGSVGFAELANCARFIDVYLR